MKLWQATLADKRGVEHCVLYKFYPPHLTAAQIKRTLVEDENFRPDIKVALDHTLKEQK